MQLNSHTGTYVFTLLQVYEARLFRLKKGSDGGILTSPEEAVDLQERTSERNHFYWSLSRTSKSSSFGALNEDHRRKRDAAEKVMVSSLLSIGMLARGSYYVRREEDLGLKS